MGLLFVKTNQLIIDNSKPVQYTRFMNAKAPAETGISTGADLSRATEVAQGRTTLIIRLCRADSKGNPHDLSQLLYLMLQAWTRPQGRSALAMPPVRPHVY